MLKDAHDAAEKAKEDLMEKSKVSEVFYLWLKAVVIFNHFDTYCMYVYMYADHAKYNFTALRCFICSQNTVQELEGYLSTEKENNRENTIQIEQLKKELIHHE